MLIVTRGWPLPLHVGAAKLGRRGTAAGEGGAQEGYPASGGMARQTCPGEGAGPSLPSVRSPASPRAALPHPCSPPSLAPHPLTLPQTRVVRARACEATTESEDTASVLL